jgi:hypothetical protein
LIAAGRDLSVEEAWSPQARAAAVAARKFKKGDRVKIKAAWGDMGTVMSDEVENRNQGDPNATETTLAVKKDGSKSPLVYRKSDLELAEGAPRLAMPSQAVSGQAAPFHEPSSSQNTAPAHPTKSGKEVMPSRSSEIAESKQTAALSVTHAPIGKGGTNWVTRSKPGNQGQLPAYIQNIRLPETR